MYRYVAFSWNSKDTARTAAAQRLARLLRSSAPDWQCVHNTPGLRVFHAPQSEGACHAYVLKHDRGVVLGRLFDGDFDENRIPIDPTFDDQESRLIIESQGRRLIEHYWGQYVAFLQEPQSRRRFVLRDPTGGLHCFMTRTAGVEVILSDMEDCVRLNITPSSVDWNHIAAFFVHMRLITRTTGFNEVKQIYAGECVATDDDNVVARSFYWNPVSVYESGSIEEADAARAALRRVIRHCVNAWGACYDSILHQLSGGLDSSIVAACLGKARERQKILCFHFFTEMTEGDERQYARVAAQSAGCELIEREAGASEISLENQLNRRRIATPSAQSFQPASELLMERLIGERNAGAIFSGQGGDHLFQEERTIRIAADYARRHGIGPELLNTMIDTSHLTGESIWSVLGATIRNGLLNRNNDPYAEFEIPSILGGDARASLRPHMYMHPWIKHACHLPPTKISHVFNIVDCQPFYLLTRAFAEQIHPLISQPIIELSLQIPSYILAHRGRARGLVREAFREDVPANIIERYSKGGTTSYFNRMLVESVDFLREFLLDGALVREGILDRCELEAQLSETALMRGDELRPILNAARAEWWLSTWTNVRQQTTV